MKRNGTHSPVLMTDVKLIQHLLNHRKMPQSRFCLRYPIDDMAQLLYNCYIAVVTERGREFISTPEIESVVWEIAEFLVNPGYKFGLYLWGKNGNGKTSMLYAIRTSLYYLYRNCRNAIPETINISSALIPIESAKDIAANIVMKGSLYMHHDIMMIDDMGHEETRQMNYGSHITPIIDLIERRYCRVKMTIISSNLSPTSLGGKYDRRIADRLNEMARIIEFHDDSFRS